MKDDLKISKVEYFPQILNYSFGNHIKILKNHHEDETRTQEKFIGNLRGNLECGSAQPSLLNYFYLGMFPNLQTNIRKGPR